MRNITPPKSLAADEVAINTQALAVVINMRCEGLIGLQGKTTKLAAIDGTPWKVEVPMEFAAHVQPGEMCILSLTLLKNTLIPNDKGIARMGLGPDGQAKQ
jgi:hypothetical protein